MGHVYTPGLKVTEFTLVKKKRILPLKGDVKVSVGEDVNPNTVVAETFLPGKVEAINIANQLGVDPEDIEAYLLKPIGEQFEKGEIYAQNKGLFGLFKTQLKAPFKGKIESISKITGQAILRAEPMPVQITAYISGRITNIYPEEGVDVESWAAFVQGIFGIGGEHYGEIIMVADNPNDILDEATITDAHRDKILIGGSMISGGALRKADSLGVAGLVVGGIDDRDLRDFLGYDIGVAITGSENIETTLIITEGFGEIPMAQGTFNLLKKYKGRSASVNGATQIRAGVIRPEIVIAQPEPPDGFTEPVKSKLGLNLGSVVRVIRYPYFGQLGKVVALPPELQVLESESKARVLKVRFEDGSEAMVPRANVEMLEG